VNDTLKLTQVHIDEARCGTTAEVRHLIAGHPTPEEAARLDEIVGGSLDEPHYYDGEVACWLRAYTCHELEVVEPSSGPFPSPGLGTYGVDAQTAHDLRGLYEVSELHEGRLVTRRVAIIYMSVAEYLSNLATLDELEGANEEGEE
jgi:hypothetical protein